MSELSVKERLGLILESVEVELDGEAYAGKYELDTKNRKSVWDWLREKLQGKTYTNKSTGKEISFSRKSLGELVSFIKNDDVYMKTLAHIPEIVENMQYLETMKNPEWKQEAGKNKGYPYFDYYITQIKMDGKNYAILSEVGRNSNGEYYYYQNVFEGTLSEVIKKIRGLSIRSPASFAGAVEQTSNNKYSKIFEIMQGFFEKNF